MTRKVSDSVISIQHDVWDAFVAQHPTGNILQTSQWGQLKSAFGWSWDVVALGTSNAPECGALVLYRPLPFKLGTIAYVPRGPLVTWTDTTQVQTLLRAIRRTARRRHAWALWIEPTLFDTPEIQTTLRASDLNPKLRAVQPPRTVLVDIAPDEDTILAKMKSKTRYNIRLSARKGVTVREGTLADVATFHALMQETGSRDEFGVHTQAYYQRALELFRSSDQAALLLAEVDGEPVAGLMAFALGTTAWYFYGASSNRHRNKMSAYAIQWAAIRWAKARGCTVYDLWGIPDEDEDTLEAQFAERHDGLWGVYRFKRGFGGQVVRYAGLWEKVLNPLYPLAAKVWEARGNNEPA